MAFEIPGFVDDHVHLVESSVSGDLREQREDPAALQRAMLAAGTNPMDELDSERALPDDLASRVLRALEAAAAFGLVSVTETGLGDIRLWHSLLELRRRSALPLRMRAYMASGLADVGMPARTGDSNLEVVGVKFYADGWLGLRTCAVNAPFADRPDDYGMLFQDAITLARRIEPYAAAGWAVATHAIGDRAVDAVLDAYEMVYGADCAEHSPRIEHCSLATDNAIQRMAELGVAVCVQPSFAKSDARAATDALGRRRRLAFRWNEMLTAGVRLTAGSDTPVESMDPMIGLSDFTRVDDDNARLSLDDALSLMTDENAGITRLNADIRSQPLEDMSVEGTILRA